jgi:hypothetical protein
MSHDFTTHPVVGEPGVGGLNWGVLLVNWINCAESAINSNLNSISGHDHDTRYFTETEINSWRNAVTMDEMGFLHGVTANIQDQIDGKAASGHGHEANNVECNVSGNVGQAIFDISGGSSIPISLASLKNWYDIMNPEISGVTIQPHIKNGFGGIGIYCAASTPIFVRTWEIIVKKNNIIIYQASSSNPSFFVDEGEGFENGDSLSVQIRLYTGTNSCIVSDMYNYTYTRQESPAIAEIQAKLTNLTIVNIIDTFVQDDAAMTAQANRVASSTLLATKVASIMSLNSE